MSNAWTESDISLYALKKCFQSPVNVWLTWLCAAPQIVLSQRWGRLVFSYFDVIWPAVPRCPAHPPTVWSEWAERLVHVSPAEVPGFSEMFDYSMCRRGNVQQTLYLKDKLSESPKVSETILTIISFSLQKVKAESKVRNSDYYLIEQDYIIYHVN